MGGWRGAKGEDMRLQWHASPPSRGFGLLFPMVLARHVFELGVPTESQDGRAVSVINPISDAGNQSFQLLLLQFRQEGEILICPQQFLHDPHEFLFIHVFIHGDT